MLDTTLWLAQSLLALFFLAAGLPKLIGRGLDRWVGFGDLPRALVVLIGLCEVAGAIALVAPMAAGHGAWTAPLAAIGIAVVALMASGFHLRQQEWLPATETALWASLAGSVAVGRWDEIATAPSVPAEVLVPVVAALVVAIGANLVVLFRQPSPVDAGEAVEPQTSARS
jgi:drug/metabolite transporter superfamily protein YnfA